MRGRARALLFSALWAAVLSALAPTAGWAGGPRWVGGPPFYTPNGFNVTWYTNTPLYFTDPGDLSPSVPHAAADALVARAAAVWNVPTANITLRQGGTLAEHVSQANISVGPSGLVFPADVQSANYLQKQISVIYDSNGSVTELLLGSGGSDPSGCLQNAVMESVDAISAGSQIQHALLILNGRCTGPAPEQQLQMQYQVMRAFGRILGLSWSQNNDNVFTGSPQPTSDQALNWPVMHPIDIICGLYTYQCMPQPFTLRADDISALSQLYYIWPNSAGAGKEDTLRHADALFGYVTFPNGQGMEGVNVTVRRREMFWTTAENWSSASSVTGYSFRRQGWPPLVAADSSAMGSVGTPEPWREGYWKIQRIPLPDWEQWQDLIVSVEPINPLYTGIYAIAPYAGNTISPSGTATAQTSYFGGAYSDSLVNFAPQDAASGCSSPLGSEGAPAAVPTEGWWNETLCGFGQVGWRSINLRAGRTLTVEVTALDEQGSATEVKAMPILGIWNSTDATGTTPTQGQTLAAFNSQAVGTSSVSVASGALARQLRLVLADQRGKGRPDFALRGRVLYADSIAPGVVPSAGGVVTITGTGFRTGTQVLVGGIAATVSSWSSTQIVATVPSLRSFGTTRGLIADVTIKDPTTGGTSVMSSAISYLAAAPALLMVSSPTGTVNVGSAAATPFAVKMVAGDGVTGLSGYPIVFSALGSGIRLTGCPIVGGCSISTGSTGVAQVTVTPTVAGAVSLSATGIYGTVTSSFTAEVVQPDIVRLIGRPAGTLTTGATSSQALVIAVLAANGTTPRPGVSVIFSSTGAAVRFGVCGAASCTVITDANGQATTTVTPVAAGASLLVATAPAGSVQQAISSANPSMRLVSSPTGVATVGVPTAAPFTIRVLAGDGITPMPGETVALSASGALLGLCSGPTCTGVTDSSGTLSTSVIASGPGAVTLAANSTTAGQVIANFNAGAKTLRLLTAPAGIATVGNPAPVPLSVRVIAGDGTTPMPGETVTLSASGGILALCGASTCTALADTNGAVSTVVTATVPGTITLTVNDAGAAGITSSFLAAPKSLILTSTPTGIATVGTAQPIAFGVRVLAGDGVTPLAGELVMFSAMGAGVRFAACGGAVCTITTDGSGLASSAITATAAGAITLTAAGSAGSITATLTAAAKQLLLVSAPSGSVVLGSRAPTAFAVKVRAGDGVTPLAGETVTFALTGGQAMLGACGGTQCEVQTDASGTASTSVTPTAEGTVYISAAAAGSTLNASVNGVRLPDILRLISAPSVSVYVGDPVATAFAVQVTAADGITPVAGAAVTFTATSAATRLDACGASTCIVLTDATGRASTGVTIIGAGAVTLEANATAGSATATLLAVARHRVVRALRPTQYVAAGSAFTWTATVLLSDDSGTTAAVPVTWSGGAGVATAADGQGRASLTTTTGPLGVGERTELRACAWTSICGVVAAQGIGAADWRMEIVSGGAQQIGSRETFSDVVLRVTDTLGSPVAATAVTVFQTVSGWQNSCPDSGRCPAAPVYRRAQSQQISDADGLVTISPASMEGAAEITSIAATAGSQGFVAVSLAKHP